MCWKSILQTLDEYTTIKEKVKKFITAQNAREGATESGSSDVGTPSTPGAEVPSEDGVSALGEDAAQDGIDN